MIQNNVSNNLAPNINIQIPILNINNKNFKKLKLTNKKYLRKKTSKKHRISSRTINKLDTITKNNSEINKFQINKIGLLRPLKNDEEIQNMEYEEAILYDKRTYIKMYWSFLLESQIIYFSNKFFLKCFILYR